MLGAIGSGKSTLIKAITGQIRLMNGSVAIEGVDLKRDPEIAKAGFGLAVDSNQLPMSLTGGQYLQLVASIRRCAADFWPCGDLTERLSFRPWLDRMIGAYSLGRAPSSRSPPRFWARPR